MRVSTFTYSPAHTIVPTYECFNRCSYCNFRVNPGTDEWISQQEVAEKLHSCLSGGVIEVLILSGEVHPDSSSRSRWLSHIYEICEQALTFGLLPHTNVGPLRRDEMLRLKSVNVSMGLMVEQITPALMQTVHRHAPSKRPDLRLQQLQQAGELEIPFTTGLLLGIGETRSDQVETLEAIAKIHQQYGHIQEVILQPHSPGTTQLWQGKSFSGEDLVELVAIARAVLPNEVAIQVPPNLMTRETLLNCLAAGASDLGGLSPIDEVNPDYPHPRAETLSAVLAKQGWQLRPRLPIYPQYDRWLSPSLRQAVSTWRKRLSAESTVTR